jgi:hypothetical protein
MAFIKTIDSASQLRDEFRAYDRYDSFSYIAYEWLFDYFEEFDSTELDVVAICCEFSEDSFEDVASNYSIDISECEDEDEIRETVLDYLNDQTSVIGSNDSIVVFVAF